MSLWETWRSFEWCQNRCCWTCSKLSDEVFPRPYYYYTPLPLHYYTIIVSFLPLCQFLSFSYCALEIFMYLYLYIIIIIIYVHLCMHEIHVHMIHQRQPYVFLILNMLNIGWYMVQSIYTAHSRCVDDDHPFAPVTFDPFIFHRMHAKLSHWRSSWSQPSHVCYMDMVHEIEL